ncbi:enoyl-CoA hydratase [Methylophaga frappieri]|uniref:Enoyl-CoA hydratase n=1 Tax=Methylophaga frappieri (strain ATCC BAA-2434 / DSM 25690 / JAM7) TaxID=754477 RepID=I1YI53_METFJ|nr:crotonase/enoyl-CoA hydratase family protein [Methylophaga frappieri]AFJ02596.1 enoyl-CoA hydratase [Methylophaga frappieri]
MNALAQLNTSEAKENFSVKQRYQHLTTHYDAKYKAAWFLMHGEPRPCFTGTLLTDIAHFFDDVKAEHAAGLTDKYQFLVLASDVPGVFNLGGDLNAFATAIENGDRDLLWTYATKCIDVLHRNMRHLDLPLTTIALVKGDALGGGFESALSSNVLIAERGTKMGLPEVLFNLFPGMGAYSLLSRKIGSSKAEQMIMSGQLYDAETLYEMGVVDILAQQGEGELAVYRYINDAQKHWVSHRAMANVKDYCNPITEQELMDITRIWVDSAMQLSGRDLRMMNRLVQRQSARIAS